MDNLTYARAVKLCRQYQSLYRLQKCIAMRTQNKKDWEAAARTLIISYRLEKRVDDMTADILLAGEEGVAA